MHHHSNEANNRSPSSISLISAVIGSFLTMFSTVSVCQHVSLIMNSGPQRRWASMTRISSGTSTTPWVAKLALTIVDVIPRVLVSDVRSVIVIICNSSARALQISAGFWYIPHAINHSSCLVTSTTVVDGLAIAKCSSNRLGNPWRDSMGRSYEHRWYGVWRLCETTTEMGWFTLGKRTNAQTIATNSNCQICPVPEPQ
jgi:hypothetical protein